MATTFLDAIVESTTSVPANITVSAGTDRGLFLCIGKVFGDVYSGITYGGQAMTLIDTADLGDAEAEVWWINDAGITAASGTAVVTSGGAGSTVGSIYFSVQGAAQTAGNIASNSLASNGTSGNVSLTRTANSLTVAVSQHDANNATTLGNPTATSNFNLGAGNFTYGSQADSAGTSNTTWSNAFSRDNATVAFNIGEVESLVIDSSPASISPTESFSFTVSGPATAPTTGNTTGNFTGLTGIAPDSVTGSDPYTITWTLPRTTAKLFDATGYVFDITIDAESVSSSAIPYEPPTGSNYVTLGTLDTSSKVYTEYTGTTLATSDQLFWTNDPALSFTDDSNYVVTGTLSATIYRIDSTGTVDVENTIVFTSGGEVLIFGSALNETSGMLYIGKDGFNVKI